MVPSINQLRIRLVVHAITFGSRRRGQYNPHRNSKHPTEMPSRAPALNRKGALAPPSHAISSGIVDRKKIAPSIKPAALRFCPCWMALCDVVIDSLAIAGSIITQAGGRNYHRPMPFQDWGLMPLAITTPPRTRPASGPPPRAGRRLPGQPESSSRCRWRPSRR